MSGIRQLSLNEIELVSSGNANGQDAGERSNYGRSTNYGAQANGFQPNYAAAGYGLLDGISPACAKAMGLGTLNVIGAVTVRNIAGFGAAATAALADIGGTCNRGNSGVPFR